MSKNYYYEYRKWAFFWGMFLDQKKEVQKVLDKYNNEGYKVVQFEWGATKLTLFKWLLVLLTMIITFGFISYWVGFSIIFEKE